MAGLGEWAILSAKENNIDAAPTPQKQDWTECYRDLREMADMQRVFQSLVDDDTVSFQVVCCFAKFPTRFQHPADKEQSSLLVSCFGMLHIRVPRRSENSNLMISPEWAILPGSKVVAIHDSHFGMTQSDNAAEGQLIADLLKQASKVDPRLEKDRGERAVPPSQPEDTGRSTSTTQTHYDLEYWLLRPRTFVCDSPTVGDIVCLAAENKPASPEIDRETTTKLGAISITNEVHTLGRVDVKPNATMEIAPDESYEMVKHAAQEELFPSSYEILRLWKAFAKRRFPRPDLKFDTIHAALWQANEEALKEAMLLGIRNAQPAVAPESMPLTVVVPRRTDDGAKSPRHPNGATVVVQTFSYTKKGHTRAGCRKRDASGGATQGVGADITFAVKVARPRPVMPTA
ncbi:hypothetical protein KVR01_011579 [Diaporthe batatas]|uniref:uncharacterized protein n=1 Tax=Diaporthe batatas TaxID=748121 RepID=UPI001D05BCAE|nr:uncharacterized protein KVR01_011579 [Diaporthe batatas]KAG8158457.1 hypothetical protein KVR01_011579 [Diaporthe batatas]